MNFGSLAKPLVLAWAFRFASGARVRPNSENAKVLRLPELREFEPHLVSCHPRTTSLTAGIALGLIGGFCLATLFGSLCYPRRDQDISARVRAGAPRASGVMGRDLLPVSTPEAAPLWTSRRITCFTLAVVIPVVLCTCLGGLVGYHVGSQKDHVVYFSCELGSHPPSPGSDCSSELITSGKCITTLDFCPTLNPIDDTDPHVDAASLSETRKVSCPDESLENVVTCGSDGKFTPTPQCSPMSAASTITLESSTTTMTTTTSTATTSQATIEEARTTTTAATLSTTTTTTTRTDTTTTTRITGTTATTTTTMTTITTSTTITTITTMTSSTATTTTTTVAASTTTTETSATTTSMPTTTTTTTTTVTRTTTSATITTSTMTSSTATTTSTTVATSTTTTETSATTTSTPTTTTTTTTTVTTTTSTTITTTTTMTASMTTVTTTTVIPAATTTTTSLLAEDEAATRIGADQDPTMAKTTTTTTPTTITTVTTMTTTTTATTTTTVTTVTTTTTSTSIEERATPSDAGSDFGDDMGSEFGGFEEGHIDGFEYDFRDSPEWAKANFEKKWEMFSGAVPTSKLQSNYDPKVDLGPVCYPTLVGPKDSNKLAILLHGFLACPGLWFRIVPRLIKDGFRVLLPTLPGHGRTWINPKGDKQKIHVMDIDEAPITNETGDLPSEGTSDLGMDLKKADDDIDHIPTDSLPYQIFGRTLGELAKQFKMDHPGGIIAVGGHSLGGAITAYYAMEIPQFVDRVMLFNPMFKLASGWSSTMASLWPTMQLSKGGKCESQRGTGSGGTCQFTLAHVKAMEKFSSSMFCHWGLRGHCEKNAKNKIIFGQMKEIQVVTSHDESSVDYSWIERFVRAVQHERLSEHGVAPGAFQETGDPTFCLWPKELGHSYLSNRVTSSSSEKWWHPYVEHVSGVFLATGKNIDIVGAGTLSHGSDCVKRVTDVEGEYLTLLPALQHEKVYYVKKPRAMGRISGPPVAVEVLFSGWVKKESDSWGRTNDRHIQLLHSNMHHDKHLIVTRTAEIDNIRDLYMIRRKGNTVNLSKQKDGSVCMEISTDVADYEIPLYEALSKAKNKNNRKRKLCGPKEFAEAVCAEYRCIDNVQGVLHQLINRG